LAYPVKTDKPLETIFPRNGGRVEARIDAGANEKAVVVPPGLTHRVFSK
jgi:hypothetical protein